MTDVSEEGALAAIREGTDLPAWPGGIVFYTGDEGPARLGMIIGGSQGQLLIVLLDTVGEDRPEELYADPRQNIIYGVSVGPVSRRIAASLLPKRSLTDRQVAEILHSIRRDLAKPFDGYFAELR